MKNKFLLAIALIFILAIIVVAKSDKFSFAISSGKTKVDVRGEQWKVQDGYSHSTASLAPKLHPVVAPLTQAIDFNKTQGDQSPIVNNSNSTSIITYGEK